MLSGFLRLGLLLRVGETAACQMIDEAADHGSVLLYQLVVGQVLWANSSPRRLKRLTMAAAFWITDAKLCDQKVPNQAGDHVASPIR